MTDRARRLTLAAVALGLAALFACSLAYRMEDHPLVRQAAAPVPQSRNEASMPPAPQETALMGLMQKMQQDPHNVDLMLEIAQLLAAQGNMDGAKRMLERAALTAPSDPRPPYLSGIQLAQAGQWEDAAQALERSLALRDDARTRYSLGVILRYHLRQEEQAREQFERAADICTDSALAAMIETERKK